MAAPGRGTVTRAGYRAYIQSPGWRAVRQRYFDSKMPQDCFVCATPRKPGMHLHHRTYENLGAERLMDLVPQATYVRTVRRTVVSTSAGSSDPGGTARGRTGRSWPRSPDWILVTDESLARACERFRIRVF